MLFFSYLYNTKLRWITIYMNYECIYNINCKYSAYKFYINDYIHLNNYTQQLQYYKIDNTKNHNKTNIYKIYI